MRKVLSVVLLVAIAAGSAACNTVRTDLPSNFWQQVGNGGE